MTLTHSKPTLDAISGNGDWRRTENGRFEGEGVDLERHDL